MHVEPPGTRNVRRVRLGVFGITCLNQIEGVNGNLTGRHQPLFTGKRCAGPPPLGPLPVHPFRVGKLCCCGGDVRVTAQQQWPAPTQPAIHPGTTPRLCKPGWRHAHRSRDVPSRNARAGPTVETRDVAQVEQHFAARVDNEMLQVPIRHARLGLRPHRGQSADDTVDRAIC